MRAGTEVIAEEILKIPHGMGTGQWLKWDCLISLEPWKLWEKMLALKAEDYRGIEEVERSTRMTGEKNRNFLMQSGTNVSYSTGGS